MISDNAKTFKATAKGPPWWGGIFEKMVQTAKRCLRKILGNARLTQEELLTAVIEVEMIVNSRPLSYVHLKISKSLSHLHIYCAGTKYSVYLTRKPSLKIAINISPHVERTSREG